MMTALQCFDLQLKGYHRIELSTMYKLSIRTVDRYLRLVKDTYDFKPTLERIIQSIESIIKACEREIHSMPEKSPSRFRGMEVQLRALMALAELLGYTQPNQVQVTTTSAIMFKGYKIEHAVDLEEVMRIGGIEYAATHDANPKT
jgi:hypothetical protein